MSTRPRRWWGRLSLLPMGLLALLLVPIFFALAGPPPTGRTPIAAMSIGSSATFDPAVCEKLPAPENRVCDFGSLFNVAGAESKVDPRYLAAVAYVESGYRDAVIDCREASPDGALGLMQFMPGTASERGVDPCSVASAIFGAAAYLRQNYDEFGSWELAAAAYNAGPQGVRNAGGIPHNGETERYVPDVMAKWAEYKELFRGAMGDCPVEPRGSTDPVVDSRSTRATQAMSAAVLACFGHEYGVGCQDRRTQDDGSEGPYEHPRGRACDFMVSSGERADATRQAHGEAMAEWVAANAHELNVLYVIWWNKIWKPSEGFKPWAQWRTYDSACISGCGASHGHFNHVHVSVKLMPGDPPSAECPPKRCTE